MKIKVKIANSSDIYYVYNSIYNTLKKKEYNTQGKIPTHISFSKVITISGSFGWSYYLKKLSLLNKGGINIKEEGEYIEIYARLHSLPSLFFYNSLLTVATLILFNAFTFSYLHILFLFTLMLGGVFIIHVFIAKLFINSLINEISF